VKERKKREKRKNDYRYHGSRLRLCARENIGSERPNHVMDQIRKKKEKKRRERLLSVISAR